MSLAAGGNPWSDEECQGVLGGTMATSGGEYALIPTLIPLNNDDNNMMIVMIHSMHCIVLNAF